AGSTRGSGSSSDPSVHPAAGSPQVLLDARIQREGDPAVPVPALQGPPVALLTDRDLDVRRLAVPGRAAPGDAVPGAGEHADLGQGGAGTAAAVVGHHAVAAGRALAQPARADRLGAGRARRPQAVRAPVEVTGQVMVAAG